jgi:ribonucleoside-diphosphate reductase alpha chain
MSSERRRLPDRRASETFSLDCAGLSYTATVSRFADGRPGEIFLNNGKAGSQADAAAKDSAIVASLALQHGVPIELLQRALLRDPHGQPSSPLGAALDLIVEARHA